MRSAIYWIISICIAAFAAVEASTDSAASTDITKGAPVSAALHVPALPLPETARAILLFIGVLAVAYCYRQAWMNFSKDSA